MRKSSIQAILASLILGNSINLNASTFSNTQKTEIQKIVKEYLLAEPEIMYEISAILQQKERNKTSDNALNVILQNKDQFIDLIANSPSVTPTNYDITIVEFFDYRCGYCKRSAKVIHDLLQTDKNIRVVFIEFPIFGDESLIATKAALAAKKQNLYYEYHQKLMNVESTLTENEIFNLAKNVGLDIDKLKIDMESTEIEKHLENTFLLARSMGLNVTPAFVVMDQLDKANPNISYELGYLTKDKLKNIIAETRNKND